MAGAPRQKSEFGSVSAETSRAARRLSTWSEANAAHAASASSAASLLLLVHTHIVHHHLLRQFRVVRRGLIRPAAGDVHDQVHGTVKRPARFGVLVVRK